MRIWETFPEVAKAVRRTHEETGLFTHHDWGHAFRVGEVARMVALDEWGDEQLSHLAGLAGLTHNADHVIRKLRGTKEDPYMVRNLVLYWLSSAHLNQFDTEQIIDAVLKHTGKNSPEDSQILIALKDSDRIVNLDMDIIVRSTQYHPWPAVDYKYFLNNPEATFKDSVSIFKHIAFLFEWADPKSPVCVRTRLAKKTIKSRIRAHRVSLNILKKQLQEEGLYPYPFEN